MKSIGSTDIWHQFGAAIDPLDDMLRAGPDGLWREPLWHTAAARPAYAQFWYRVYHALCWLDLSLTGAAEGFTPPAPVALIAMEADDLPDRGYPTAELQAYLQYCRTQCQVPIDALPDEPAHRRCRCVWGDINGAAVLRYTMRPVQELAAQVRLLRGQQGGAVGTLSPAPEAECRVAKRGTHVIEWWGQSQ